MKLVSIMPMSMTSRPTERIPSMRASPSSGLLGRMSRPTTMAFSRPTFLSAATPWRLRLRNCAAACPTFHAASASRGSGVVARTS